MCVSTGRACDGLLGFVLLFVFVSGVSVCGCVSLSLSISLSLSVCVCLCVCLRTYTVKKSKGLYKGKQGLKEDPGIYMYHFFFSAYWGRLMALIVGVPDSIWTSCTRLENTCNQTLDAAATRLRVFLTLQFP